LSSREELEIGGISMATKPTATTIAPDPTAPPPSGITASPLQLLIAFAPALALVTSRLEENTLLRARSTRWASSRAWCCAPWSCEAPGAGGPTRARGDREAG
jgi:hypothetical protein